MLGPINSFDEVEDPRIGGEVHPRAVELVRLGDLLDRPVLDVSAEQRQLDAVGALGERVSSVLEGLQVRPQPIDLVGGEHVLNGEVAVFSKVRHLFFARHRASSEGCGTGSATTVLSVDATVKRRWWPSVPCARGTNGRRQRRAAPGRPP